MAEEMIPITFFIAVLIILCSAFYFNNKNKQQQQKTIQKLIESGQALSPELLESIGKPAANNASNRDFARGVILVSFSFALFLYGVIINDDDTFIRAASVFPLFIGVAYLIIHKFKPKED